MPRPTKGKRLGGSPSHEDQIVSGLIKSIIEYEKIETTVTKAKVAKPYIEKVITKAKKIFSAIAINEISLLRQSKQTASLQIFNGRKMIIKKLISEKVIRVQLCKIARLISLNNYIYDRGKN